MPLAHLECGLCRTRHEADRLQTVCSKCGGSLLARYDLAALKKDGARERWSRGPRNLWRFSDLLPVRDEANRITLGEGLTPLLRVDGPARALGLSNVWIKDEGLNPTGTFKARGLCLAVARGVELGAKRFAVPTAGNAGVALAAYAARAGAAAHVFVPRDAPPRVLDNLARYGAEVQTVSGLISDAGKACAQFVSTHPGTLDVSTLKEPYRAEGKKTMGFELCQDFDWGGPDTVVYPAGGGTGVIGIHKAYEELRALGWTQSRTPRIVVVQAEGCAPIVDALRRGADTCKAWPGAHTAAAGLRVPKPFADRLVLAAVRATGGSGVDVSEEALAEGARTLARAGISASPESGAAWAGLEKLARDGTVGKDERIVVFNTGSALAY